MSEVKIDKCPACGALRNSTDVKCPECGYEYTSAAATVIDKLNFDLSRIGFFSANNPSEYNRQLSTLIENFHIPQVKRELFDLMLFLQPKAMDETAPMAAAWRRRQKEVIERAKHAFTGTEDKKYLETILSYERDIKAAEKKNQKNFWQKMPLVGKILSIIAILFVVILLIPAKDISPEAYSVRFSEAVEAGKWDKAMEHLQKCPQMGTSISDYYLTLIDGLIADDRVMEAENLFKGVVNYVDPAHSKEHLAATMHNFIDKFISQSKIEYAGKYALEMSGIVKVMKAYINAGDTKGGLAFYKANASKFTKYDYSLHRNVFLCEDEQIKEFLNNNGIKTE